MDYTRIETLEHKVANIDARLSRSVEQIRQHGNSLRTRIEHGLTRADETRSWYLHFREEANDKIERIRTRLDKLEQRTDHTTDELTAFNSSLNKETQENFERVKAFGADLHSKHEQNATRLDNHRGILDQLRSKQDEIIAIVHQHTLKIGVHEEDIKRIEAMANDLDARVSVYDHVAAERATTSVGKLDLRQQERLNTGLAFIKMAIDALDPYETGNNAEQVSHLYQAMSCLQSINKEG